MRPGLLHGLAQQTAQRNRCAELPTESQGRLLVKAGTGNFKQVEGWKRAEEEEVMNRTEGMLASILALRRSHVTFDPANPGADGTSVSRSDAVKKQRSMTAGSREETREHWDLLKYVRKIEPEIPPLVRRIYPDIPHPPRPDQKLVLQNATQEALESCKTTARLQNIASRAAQRDEQRRLVVEKHNMQKAEFRQRNTMNLEKKDASGSSSFLAVSSHQADGDAILKHWLTSLAVCSFMRSASLEYQMRRMPIHRRLNFVRAVEAKIGMVPDTMIAVSSSLKQTLAFRDAMHSDAFLKNRLMVGKLARSKLDRRRHRSAALTLCDCLNNWWGFGSLLVKLRVINANIIAVQRWWRRCSVKLSEIKQKVSARWLKIERKMVSQMYEDEGVLFPDEKDVHRRLVSEHQRSWFLDHELRARRYYLLPQLRIWKEDSDRKALLLKRWQERRRMNKQKASDDEVQEETYSELLELVMVLPIPTPTQIPADKQMRLLIARCRSHHHHEGWIQIVQQDPKKSMNALFDSASSEAASDEDVMF